MLGPLKKKKLSAAFDQSGVILFIWGYTVKTGHKEATLCVSLPLSVASFSLPHTHGARAHSFLCLCAHTAVDLALGSTKVKIWYITQRLIDFSTPGELPALSTGVRERETDRVRGRKSESSTLCSTKSDSLTGFPGCSWNYRPLCPQIHCGHMAEQKCVCTHMCVRYLIIRGITIVKENHGDWEFASASVTNVRHVRLAWLIFRLTLPWLLQPCTAMPLLTHTNVHRAQSKINDLSQSFNTLGCRGYTACPIYCHQ